MTQYNLNQNPKGVGVCVFDKLNIKCIQKCKKVKSTKDDFKKNPGAGPTLLVSGLTYLLVKSDYEILA
jgi:hypothetical protein